MISQGWEGVEVFFQADALRDELHRRLAAKPDDAEALRLQGEVFLQGDHLQEAVASFRRAYQLVQDERTRDLLRESLLNGLQTEFAAYRGRTEEIERLLDDASQRAVYLRLMADGLQQAHEWRPSLDHYLRLIELDRGNRGMEIVDRSLAVRRDLWIRAGMAALRRQVPAATAAEIDQVLQQQLKAAVDAKSADALRSFLAYFDGSPAAAAARRELIRQLIADKRDLEVEMLLWPDRQSSDRAVAGSAVAQLAELFAETGHHESAAACYRELRGQFSDVVCRDGKTGKQLVEALPKDGPLGPLLQPAAAWPSGKVEVVAKVTNVNSNYYNYGYGRSPLQFENGPGPFYAGRSLRFDQNRSALLVYDEFGREQQRSQVPLAQGGQPVYYYNGNPQLNNAYVQGHLLVVPLGHKIFGLDPLGLAGTGSRQLWCQDLTDSSRGFREESGQPGAGAAAGVGLPPFVLNNYQSRPTSVASLDSHRVCFQRFRNLVAVDTLTGELLWVRHDIQPGSIVFGDDQYIFVLSPRTDHADMNARRLANMGRAARISPRPAGSASPAGLPQAMVLRAEDGALLGERSVPAVNYPFVNTSFNAYGPVYMNGPSPAYAPGSGALIGTVGRYILTCRHAPNEGHGMLETLLGRHGRTYDKTTLEFFDPWEQRAVWPARTFHGAQTSMVGEQAVGVMEPDGHFVLVELPSGRTIADLKLDADDLQEITVIRSGDQYLLLTHGNVEQSGFNRFPAQPVGNLASYNIQRGRLYAIDLQGKLMWPKPVEVRNRWYPLGQPEGLPMVVFAHQQFEQRNPAMGMWTSKTHILCIDKRTGQTLYRNDDTLKQTYLLDIVGNPERKTVELRMQNETVALTFTDKPISAKSAGQSDPGSDWPTRSKIGNSLWKAVRKSVEGMDVGGMGGMGGGMFSVPAEILPQVPVEGALP